MKQQLKRVIVETPTQRVVLAIAHLSRADFSRLGLGSMEISYEDWVDERLGFQLGLSAAGVDVVPQTISFDDLVTWCALNQRRVDLDAADRYATFLSPTGLGAASPYRATCEQLSNHRRH